MATVYLATDLKHGRQVALKVLKPELAAPLGATVPAGQNDSPTRRDLIRNSTDTISRSAASHDASPSGGAFAS
jgi:hypothetical protein